MEPLMDRVWALGPRGVGPNMLLSPPLRGDVDGEVAVGSLFSVPPSLVVRIGRQVTTADGENDTAPQLAPVHVGAVGG